MPREKGLKIQGLRERLQKVIGEVAKGNAREFARQAGVPYTTLKGLEQKESEPGAITAQRIARAAGRTVEWLLTGKDSIYPDAAHPMGSPGQAAASNAGGLTRPQDAGLWVKERELINLVTDWRHLEEAERQYIKDFMDRALEHKRAGAGPPEPQGEDGRRGHGRAETG